jgi:CHAD domain-containing protein
VVRQVHLRLRRSEPATRGLRRIALGHLTLALACLQAAGPKPEAVHELRRQLKQARATLRLLRPALGAQRLDPVERRIVRSAQRWSALRDLQALQPRLEALGMAGPPPVDPASHARSMSLTRRELQRVMGLIRAWRITADDEALLEDGLRESYRHGRRSMRQALRDSGDSDWHRWRRHAKTLALQLALFETWNSRALERLGVGSAQLERLLGEDHDLAVLLERALGDGLEPEQRTDLLQQRRVLQQRAAALGAALYAKPFRKLRRNFHRARERWLASASRRASRLRAPDHAGGRSQGRPH